MDEISPSEELKNPGSQSLLFKPSKVSWVINSYLTRQNNQNFKWFVYSVLALIFAFILWCSFSEKAIVIDATGEIISKTPPLPVTTNTSMTIRSIKVKDNQIVKKDDVLIVSTRELSESDQNLIVDAMNSIKKNIALDKKNSCFDPCFLELRNISDEGFPWMARLDSNSELYRNLSQLLRAYKDFILLRTNLSTLPATTANLRYEINSAKQQRKEIEKRNAEHILAVEYDQLKSKIINLESQLKEKNLGILSQLNSARNMTELSLQSVLPSLKNYSRDAMILAPSEGVITFADLKGEGQIINPGQLLLYINAKSTELAVKLKLLDTDISKIKKGMEIKLDISSYPATEFGVQSAKITEIPEKINRNSPTSVDNTFEVYGDLQNQGVLYKEQLRPLRSGVSLRAKIIVKHERLIFYYIKKLLSIKDDYLGES